MKYKKGTFVTVPNIDSLDGQDGACQSLFMWLCKYADEDGMCFPSRSKLASNIGCTTRTLDKHITRLEVLGLIAKTLRPRKGSSGQTSNVYQILIATPQCQLSTDPSEVFDTPPREENDTLTVSNTNSIHITKVLTQGQLPQSRGNSYILRVLSVYRDLFRDMYSVNPTVDMGRFGKSVKALAQTHTECQIAALMITFFGWHGMTGSDQFERDKLLKAAFNPSWFFSSVTQYEVYLRNVFGLDMDNEEKVRAFVGSALLALNK